MKDTRKMGFAIFFLNARAPREIPDNDFKLERAFHSMPGPLWASHISGVQKHLEPLLSDITQIPPRLLCFTVITHFLGYMPSVETINRSYIT